MQPYINPSPFEWTSITERPTASYESIEPLVASVFKAVLEQGDQAIIDFTLKFDGIKKTDFKVSDDELENAASQVPENLKKAIQNAKANIECFHKAQLTDKVQVTTQTGVECWQEKKPIEKVGLYIPGGSAPLFSTILMLAIPAQIAGCKEIVMCSPPSKDGTLPAVVLYTAQLCGLKHVYKIGGIQAVAAMALGTQSLSKVHKIFGPGNQYVTVAKQWATRHQVAIDMPAGPSELLVVADASGNPDFIAADLLSQAEHGKDSQVLFVTTHKPLMKKVSEAIEAQVNELPRKEIALAALSNSKAIYFEEDSTAINFINSYGPEHYIICVENEELYLDKVINAGSVFVGNYTPESAGDYASGTNHTLPTNGYAKQYSGVNLDSFRKAITFQKITKEGIQLLGETVELMAAAEGLQAHKNAVSIRLKALENEI
ncbi:MAG: histidinol dehydrogenase [Flavobacteriaceae bacterium]|nr:histidinol dehydrogenase [Flavobacteriaceae bacterium]